MIIEEKVYEKMPSQLRKLFDKLPNPGSDEVVELFPDSKSTKFNATKPNNPETSWKMVSQDYAPQGGYDETGSAARFFYCAKTNKDERGLGNSHPTVKPLALMRYLCKLVTPSNGNLLDPFCGSGSTLVAAKQLGFNAVGIEKEIDYVEISEVRVEFSELH